MYTILVADDEAIIREGIKVLFDYAALGFSICGEAADGDQALAQIQALQPDVVLMDIRMPGLTGLEVIRQARAQGYRGKVIIVSSYSDFKYAQEAIRQGVQYYITKPIDEEELEQVLRDFKTAFDRERSARNASEHYRQKARSAIVKELLLGTGALPPQAAAEIGLLADRYQAVILEKYSQAQPGELPDFASLLRVNNQEGRFFEATVLEGAQVLLLKGEAAGQRFRALLERFQHEKSAPHRELPGNCFLCCGEPVTRLQDICLSYRQALRAQSRRFFCQQEQHVLPYSALPPEDTIHPVLTRELPGEYTQQLLRYIQSFNRNMLAQTLKELQEQLTHSSDSEEAIKLFFTDLHLQVKEQMRRKERLIFCRARGEHSLPVANLRLHAVLPFPGKVRTGVPANGNKTALLPPLCGSFVYTGKIIVHIVQPPHGGELSGVRKNVIHFIVRRAHPGGFLLGAEGGLPIQGAEIFIDAFGGFVRIGVGQSICCHRRCLRFLQILVFAAG